MATTGHEHETIRVGSLKTTLQEFLDRFGGTGSLKGLLSSLNDSLLDPQDYENKVLVNDRGSWSFQDYNGGGGGEGSVTSVGLLMPAGFTVSNSPIRSSGDIEVRFGGTVQKKMVLAAPAAQDGPPSWRSLVASDIDFSGYAWWGQTLQDSGQTKAVTGPMTGVTSIDTLLHFDTTNNRIGVGNTAPAVKFDVLGDMRVTGRLYLYKDDLDSTKDVYLEYVNGHGGVHLAGAGLYADTYVSALGTGSGGGGGTPLNTLLMSLDDTTLDPAGQDNQVLVCTNGSWSWKSYSSGGGGTSTIAGATDFTTYFNENTITAKQAEKLAESKNLWGNAFDGTRDLNGDITIDHTGTTPSLFVARNGTGEVRLAAYETNRGLWDASGSGWLIGTGPGATNPNTFLMRGNVGVGTTEPKTALHVKGSVMAERTGSEGGGFRAVYGNYMTMYNTNAYGYGIISTTSATATSATVRLSFTPYDAATAYARFRDPVEVGWHNTYADDGTYIQIGAVRIVYDQANNALKVVGQDGSTAANLYATGAVSALGAGSGGGGGTPLNSLLMSLNDANPSPGAASNSVLVCTNGSWSWKSYSSGGGGTSTIAGATDFTTYFNENTITAKQAEKLAESKNLWGNAFDGSGNVSGAMTFSTLALATNFTDVWEDDRGNSHPWYGYDHRYNNTGVFSTTITDRYGMTLHTSQGCLCMTEGGNVGIGTTSPQYRLDVAGKIRVGSTSYANLIGISGQYLELGSNGNEIYISGSGTSMHVNGGGSGFSKTIPTTWQWHAGPKQNNEYTWAGFVLGTLEAKTSIKIGSITIKNENGGLHIIGGGLYTDTYLSALGTGSGGSGGGSDFGFVLNGTTLSVGTNTSVDLGSQFVTLSTTQTITGAKTFNGSVGIGAINTNYDFYVYGTSFFRGDIKSSFRPSDTNCNLGSSEKHWGYGYINNMVGNRISLINLPSSASEIAISGSNNTGYINANNICNPVSSITIQGDSSSNDHYNSTKGVNICTGGGNVGIGASAQSGYKLYVNGETNINGDVDITKGKTIYFQHTASGVPEISIGTGTGSNDQNLYLKGINLYFNSSIISSSDMRLKDVDELVDGDVESIARAPIFYYRWKKTPEFGLHLGSSAQYWQNVFSCAVVKDEEGYLGLDYAATALAAAVMTARKVLDHEGEIKALRKRIGELEQEVEQLKAA